MVEAPAMRLAEGRFARLEAIQWWDQPLLARTRVLVIGAGALGNEVIKNLALLGIGHLAVADMDHVERSNLCRSVLFRSADEGRPKAACATAAAQAIYPELQATALVVNVLAGLGLGWFRWADAVIGALDNREARVFVNAACAQMGRPWFDGGIEVLQGVARGFAPPRTACYECTMSEVDWSVLNKRRSCSLLARRAVEARGTPTTPIAASVIGAIQVQEMIKLLHGRDALLGGGFVFEGGGHQSYRVNYPVNPDCPWHEPPPPVQSVAALSSGAPLAAVWAEGVRQLGKLDALDLSRELVERAECTFCRHSVEVLQPAELVREDQLICPGCRRECSPVFVRSVGPASRLLEKTPRELGLPAWDVIWARHGTQSVGLELSGDDPFRDRSQSEHFNRS